MYKITNNSNKGIQWHAVNPESGQDDPFYVPAGASVIVSNYAVDNATDLQSYIDSGEITVTAT